MKTLLKFKSGLLRPAFCRARNDGGELLRTVVKQIRDDRGGGEIGNFKSGSLFNLFLTSLKICIFTLLLIGAFYPILVMGGGYLFFYKKASGSLVFDEHKHIVGSELIGQYFQNPGYFFPRPSNAGKGYDGLQSGGSNLSPASKEFVGKIQERFQKLKSLNAKPIPLDLLTSSGSGLDPDISPQAAYWQAPKIALSRNVSLKRVESIIDEEIQNPQLYILGEPRVNVLKLNLTLDQFFGPPGEVK